MLTQEDKQQIPTTADKITIIISYYGIKAQCNGIAKLPDYLVNLHDLEGV